MKIGELDVSKIYLGSAEIEKIYLGTSQVYGGSEPTHDYSQDYLTFESTSDNNTIYWKSNYSNQFKTISASTDNGSTWTAYTSTTGNGRTIATLNSGDTIIFKGENAQYNKQGIFGSSSSFITYGNIMSLVYGDNFSGQTTLTSGGTFVSLFSSCSGLASAENLVLPATTLAYGCYSSMFEDCRSLTTAPSILPATTLVSNCYNSMFLGCTNLTTAPELSATTLAENCYYQMFHGCASLSSITCYATDISATECTTEWVGGVNDSGSFFVPSGNPASWKCGSDGVPSNWTIEDTNGDTYECTGGGAEPSTDVPLENGFAVKVNGEWQESMGHISSIEDIEYYLGDMGIYPFEIEELAIGNNTSDINLDGEKWNNCTGLTIAPNVQSTSNIHNFPPMQWVNVMGSNFEHMGFSGLFSFMNCCPIYVPEEYLADYQMRWKNETTDDCQGSVADRLVGWSSGGDNWDDQE